jgi:hypothetical protein
MTFDIGIRYYISISNVWHSISNAQNLINIDIEGCYIRYRSSRILKNKHGISISTQFDIEETSILKFRTSISLYTDIEYFSTSTNAPSISVYDIEFFFASVSNFVFFDIGFFCRIQPGLPARYWTQIAVCTLHCKSIIFRGSCAARAALSRRSGGCTRRRSRSRCNGRSTGRSRQSGARPPERRPQSPEQASTERRSAREELTSAKFSAAGAADAATGAGINGTQERVILGDNN